MAEVVIGPTTIAAYGAAKLSFRLECTVYNCKLRPFAVMSAPTVLARSCT
ncbi:MAG: hypothetical protein M3256_20460 [Actinomycetota bacterium]|nr:hypothetical protein [Actinomycetota bacterium]